MAAHITDPQPYLKSLEPPKEEAHTKRSGISGIDAHRPGWWPGYVEGVIEALSRLDRAREYHEIARGTSTPAAPPRSSTRL